MKAFFLLVASLSALAYCQNPCEDPRYLELKKKPLESMSQREFEYFMLKERYCIEEAQKSSARPCSLVVTIDTTVIDGKEKDMRVFVDDVEMSPVSKRNVVAVSPGLHKVSLFSLEEIDDYEKKINRRIMTNENKNFFYGIGVMEAKLKQMKNTVKAINAAAGGRIQLHYRFTCDTGKTGKCTDDGWSLVPELH